MTPANVQRFLQRRFPRQLLFLRARLAPQGLFGLHFTIGVAVLIGAARLFGGIAEDLITGDPLILIDTRVSEWFRCHATPRFTEGMHYASALASTSAVVILCVIMTCVLLGKRLWHWLLGLVFAVAGGIVLNLLLKDLFDRARPSWADLALADAGFPSGHTMMATLIYGFIATYLILQTNSWPARFLIALIGIALVFLVALSRLYLGAHYLSDVLGAMAAGMVWLTLCLTTVEILHRYRIQSSSVHCALPVK